MIRLSLFQLRVQAITAAVVVAAFAILLAVTGPHLASMYAASGVRGCKPARCSQLASSFLQRADSTGPYATVSPLSIILILLTPAVIGLFWGAPLIARELETGTFALAWSQSVTRTRWLTVKLAVGGLAAMAITEALSLLFSWWATPLRHAAGQGGSGNSLAMNQFNPLAFATHGITPLGYAAFAFSLGVTVGALIQRTVPAMAITLAVFAALQIAMPLWVRPNLLPASHTTIAAGFNDTTLNLYTTDSPHTFTYTLTAEDGLPGQPEAWIRSSAATNATGHPVSTVLPSACSRAASSGGPGPGLATCLTRQGIRLGVTYQPASRYWPLQWTETGIYLVLSLALAATSYWWTRKRFT
jgi:ABC-type transport system involved in multi-copper enzyme maturation permease subunit